MANLTQSVAVMEVVAPPKFIEVDDDELDGAYDSHRSKRGLANVNSTKSYWEELMIFLHSTGKVLDPNNPLTEENRGGTTHAGSRQQSDAVLSVRYQS